MVVFVKTAIAMGAASDNKEDITNIERFTYRGIPQPTKKAVVVMDTIAPLSFKQGHKWVEGEIHVKSEAREAIHSNGSGPIDYLPAGDAPVVPYFVVTLTGHDATSWTVTITGAKFSSEELTHSHDGDAITIYKFVAMTAVLAPP